MLRLSNVRLGAPYLGIADADIPNPRLKTARVRLGMTAICGARDWIDCLSAVGPTLAAFVAVLVSVWATIVARRGAAAMEASTELQRSISRPRLTVLQATGAQDGGSLVSMELQNSGQTAARVVGFKVFADGKEQPYTDEPASQYWAKVLSEVGLTQVGSLAANMFKPGKHTVPGGTSQLLMSAVIPNVDPLVARGAVRKVIFEVEYRSNAGDVYRIP